MDRFHGSSTMWCLLLSSKPHARSFIMGCQNNGRRPYIDEQVCMYKELAYLVHHKIRIKSRNSPFLAHVRSPRFVLWRVWLTMTDCPTKTTCMLFHSLSLIFRWVMFVCLIHWSFRSEPLISPGANRFLSAPKSLIFAFSWWWSGQIGVTGTARLENLFTAIAQWTILWAIWWYPV